ncbi:MAG: hypothetical protein ACPGJS_10985 [Flammeovirgaceae bacterium]
MKKYHIILLIISLLTSQQLYGQTIPRGNWNNLLVFDCNDQLTWSPSWGGDPVPCSADAKQTDLNYDVFVQYRQPTNGTCSQDDNMCDPTEYDTATDCWKYFPVGQEGVKITVGTKLCLRLWFNINNADKHNTHFGIARFYSDYQNPSTGQVEEIHGENIGSHHWIADYTFIEPGKYLIYAWFPLNNEERVAIGWVYVMPKVDCLAGNIGCEFSACYVGPDGICPTSSCDCDNIEPNPDMANTDYYWSGTENPVGEPLLYQAPLQARSLLADDTEATDAHFYWYASSDQFSTDFLPHKNIAGQEAKGTGSEIAYRLTGPSETDSYYEEVWVRAARGGILSETVKFKITRNLAPESLYEVAKDCFGFSAEFINTSDIRGEPSLEFIWHFGDGGTRRYAKNDTPDKIEYEYLNAGYYEPVLQIRFAYPGCDTRSVFTAADKRKSFDIEDIQLSLDTPTYNSYQIPNVLGASAASFQDSWVMALGGEAGIRNLNPFANGQRGLWRGEGGFSLIKDRTGAHEGSYETAIDMQHHGDFTLDAFNWQAHAGPNWVKASTITEYSPYGSELENKDVLERYSTALFGYNGELSTAVGANMRQREMAFTGFEEEVKPGTATAFHQANAGNFNITNQEAMRLRKVKVLGGNQQVGIIEYPFLDLEKLRSQSNITLNGHNVTGGGSFTIEDVTLGCKFRDVRNAEQAVVRFDGAGLDALGSIWKGELSYYEQVKNDETNAILSTDEAEIVDGVEAHTGRRSLRVKVDFEQRQNYLDLEEGKEYVISAWVKVNTGKRFDLTYQTDEAVTDKANRLGIGVKNAAGTYLALLEPAGTIIEGWQRIQGKFTYQTGSEELILSFQKGGNPEIYLDDIRLFPNLGNMQSYVYELGTYRLLATLDNNNYATLYSYDSEGNLFLIKKETIEGIKTIQESLSHQKGSDDN